MDSLDSPITSDEFQRKRLQISNNKAPGPDGFPAEFFRHFWQTISPLFLRMSQTIQLNSKILPHMNTAIISVLLKPDKDPTLPSSYRPLSLINTDIKIISKALAIRIETVTPFIIHSDQTRFIKGRHSYKKYMQAIQPCTPFNPE